MRIGAGRVGRFLLDVRSCLAERRQRADPSSEQEERRVVTVLFADLAGSTSLGERLDPEDVRALQGELFALVNAEVERFGGVSEKFMGDAVLAVFGIPQAHEDDPERAVRAALAVQQAFPAFAAAIGERHDRAEVALRIGVNTGEVVTGRDAAARGELMVSGDAVNVAARLQQLASREPCSSGNEPAGRPNVSSRIGPQARSRPRARTRLSMRGRPSRRSRSSEHARNRVTPRR